MPRSVGFGPVTAPPLAGTDALPKLARLRSGRAPAAPPHEVPELTARELDVLRLVAVGATNGEIAADLVVGEATVKTHISSIFAKLGVRDRAAAIVFAFDRGLVEPSPPGTR